MPPRPCSAPSRDPSLNRFHPFRAGQIYNSDRKSNNEHFPGILCAFTCLQLNDSSFVRLRLCVSQSCVTCLRVATLTVAHNANDNNNDTQLSTNSIMRQCISRHLKIAEAPIACLPQLSDSAASVNTVDVFCLSFRRVYPVEPADTSVCPCVPHLSRLCVYSVCSIHCLDIDTLTHTRRNKRRTLSKRDLRQYTSNVSSSRRRERNPH